MKGFQTKQHQVQQPQIQSQAPVYEKTVPFSQARAFIWQIKFALNNVNSKKTMTQTLAEISNLSEHFGKEFDKYVLKEFIEIIDLKDAIKSQKDKNESQFLLQMLNQELSRTSQKPEFLQYFSEIAFPLYDHKITDFLNDLTKKLKLSYSLQLLIALSLFESSKAELQPEGKFLFILTQLYQTALKLLKTKLIELNTNQQSRIEGLPEYSIHKILVLLKTHSDMINDEAMNQVLAKIQESFPFKSTSFISLRESLNSNLYSANAGNPFLEESSISILKEGGILDNLDKTSKMLEPWEVLLDMGPQSTNDYNNFLLPIFSDFRDISEKTLMKTLLYLSHNHHGYQDQTSRMVQTLYDESKRATDDKKKEDSKKSSEDNRNRGKGSQSKEEKKTQLTTWNIENLSRLFRELYSSLNWNRVFEALADIEDNITLDYKSFQVFLQLINKCKPQNVPFPLSIIIEQKWVNPDLQLNFIENCIHTYLVEKKERSINFQRLSKRQEMIDEIQGYKDKVQVELMHIWLSIDLSERLIELSNSASFHKIRQIFEQPLKTLPDYLLLTLSHTKPTQGNLMLDELLSLLLPQFLGNHINSIPVLQQLWKSNQQLMIRGICELCRHDQRIMNLSRVLDITQEVKESLLPIVNCEDYYFAVNLGILAGKRDFLHYDVWLQSRILTVGTPFIKALLKYIKDHIINPIVEFQEKRKLNNQQDNNQDALENFKNAVLEKSHLSKEKLCLTLEHLQNPSNSQNANIRPETLEKIRQTCVKTTELFPSQSLPTQNSEEIDNAANEYFQKVFSAAPEQVDSKIAELIDIMQKFKESDIKKQQEIYACMLHSLFDEYRFLHRYPQQFLEKIAKLFGQIIKNKIIEGTLHEIALKFAYEAFRREGRRQKFGVIVIRQFFDMLPQFPSFFKDIYEIRHNLAQSEPQMIQDLERLWEVTKQEERKNDVVDEPVEQKKPGKEKSIFSQQKEDELKQSLLNQKSDKKQLDTSSSIFQKGKNKPNFLPDDYEQEPQSQQQKSSLIQPNQQQQTQQQLGKKSDIPRTTTPSMTVGNVFYPSYKTSVTNSGSVQSETSGLKITSEEFKRGGAGAPPTTTITQPVATQNPSTFQQQTNIANTTPVQTQPSNVPPQSTSTQLNPNVGIFLPSNIRSSSTVPSTQNAINNISQGIFNQQQPINQQMQQYLEQINAKIQKAQFENTKLRIEDIIEDPQYLNNGPNIEAQESIKRICNNVAKSNLSQKQEELRNLLKEGSAIQNLQWFIHYILSKRVTSTGGQNLYSLYIDLIKQSNIKLAIEYTVTQVIDSFKKCIVMDEEAFLKVAQRTSLQNNPIKSFICNIGQFLGQLTLGNNRPILAKELDLKQLLIEACQQQEKLKFVLVFICRILKEGTKSNVFKPTNPWISGLLQLLREIKESQTNNTELINEVESLFRTMNLNIIDFPPSGILRALQTQQFQNQSQQIELSYLLGKATLLLPSIISAYNRQQQTISPIPNTISLTHPLRGLGGGAMSTTNAQQDQAQMQQQQQQIQKQQIYDRITVSADQMTLINKLTNQQEPAIKSLFSEAVESSIVEILPPVVDRSVTIALITTRELVLKDFAYDGDPQKILKAADLIVKNLAGSLALVTCREPLKMSLTTNLRKSLQLLIGTQLDQQQEAQVQEIAKQASNDNLELGCKLIKKAVIEKAQKKVKEEPYIERAIQVRQRAQELQQPFFRDEAVISQISELPPQLQPSPNGLSDAQFQVYEDFSRLSMTQKKIQQEQDSQNAGNQSFQQQYEQLDVDTIFKSIEQSGLNNFNKSQLMNKIRDLNQDRGQEDEKKKLDIFVQKWFLVVTSKFIENQNINDVQQLFDALSMISQHVNYENMSQKITNQFLSFNDSTVFNIELTLLLIKNKIISINEWDKSLAHFLNSSVPQTNINENLLKFLSGFIKLAVQELKVVQYHQVGYLMEIIEKLSSNKDISIYFKQILEDYKKKPSLSQQNRVKEYFAEWVKMNYSESANIEQDINKFFLEFTQADFIKDSEMMSNFCKVMVEVSVEKALYMSNGQKRPSDRLDYRHIDCFIKLIIVLMKTQQYNKHKFMVKLFEAIQEVLDNDHRENKFDFNQKPYYTLLMKVLTTLNFQQTNIQQPYFNSQTQQLILISLADLFNKLNPNKYPAFAFSWIELISHKHFMPHFLKAIQGESTVEKQQKKISQTSSDVDNMCYDKYFKFKDIVVHLFTFLKNNMNSQTQCNQSMAAFYQATFRVCLVILNDFPEFFCDFHFNFVNSLPDNCIQLRNVILSSFPQNIVPPNPFQIKLKVDLLQEVQQQPRIHSSYESYLQIMNLREDLESFVRTKQFELIDVICDKIIQSGEEINGKKKINNNVINAVVLFIANQASLRPVQAQQQQQQQGELTNKESMEFFKQLMHKLNNETRWSLLNSIVNELRFPNNHTYYFSCIILHLFNESQNEFIQEQISRILFERLSVNRPHPWGLMISFRELIQNPKYNFMKKSFITQNQASIDQLFQTRLQHFRGFLSKNAQQQKQ